MDNECCNYLDLSEVAAVRQAIQAGRLTQERHTTLSGNDAIAKAALEAGARFFGGYPITPSTEVLEYAARNIFSCGAGAGRHPDRQSCQAIRCAR